MIGSLIILGVLVVIELILKPRIDQTREGQYLLWYGRSNRKYVKL